ncbi:MAG: DEAD/DEAH box helicase family protein, partial [Psittacicella sp.]
MTKEGLALIKAELIELKKAGIKGKILISDYLLFNNPEVFLEVKKFNNIDLRISFNKNLHAKGYIFKDKYSKYKIIIGSTNLTANAFLKNKEWDILFLEKCENQNKIFIETVLDEFNKEFELAKVVDLNFIESYRKAYLKSIDIKINFKSLQLSNSNSVNKDRSITLNSMQIKALNNIKMLRKSFETKAFIIAATGTGKTYLSALDSFEFKAKNLLFLSHRNLISKKALESFKKVFNSFSNESLINFIEYKDYSKELKNTFIFSTVQTFSMDKNLSNFSNSYFDYIVIDEAHRSSSKTYQKILNYFK